MADTLLSIANRALQHAGARAFITSLEENSNEARNVNLLLDAAVREVQTEVRWNFNAAYLPGVSLGPSLAPQWRFAFGLPVDALSIRALHEVATVSQSVPIFGSALLGLVGYQGPKVVYALAYQAGVRAILTNISSCVVAYTANVADFASWQPHAITLLEYRLASKLAIPVSGDKALAQMLLQLAENTKTAASMVNANEDLSQQNLPVDWLDARGIDDEMAEGTSGGAPTSSTIIINEDVPDTITPVPGVF